MAKQPASLRVKKRKEKRKDRPNESQTEGIVYKVKCQSCDFTYVGETKRSWNSRGSEHKPDTRNNRESAIKDHAETTDHDIFVNHVQILEKNVNNWHKRFFWNRGTPHKTIQRMNESPNLLFTKSLIKPKGKQ